MPMSTHGQVQHINPDGLTKNPAFTNIVTVTSPVKTIYIGGQDAIDSSGTVIGKGDIQQQAEQVFKNLEVALQAVDAGLEHIIKWNIYVVHGQPIQPALEVFQHVWGRRPNPPAITMMFVSGLSNPDFLLEIDAIAALPE